MTKRVRANNLPFPATPDQRYTIIDIDPPWHFESRAPSANPEVNRNPQRHYATADEDHLATIPMRQIAAPNCLLFLWITGPKIVEGAHIRLFKAWGFRGSSMAFVWVKLKRGFDTGLLRRTPLLEADLHVATAFTTLQNCEYVIMARRGSHPRQQTNIRQVIVEPVRDHSRKPESYYKRVEAYGGDVPRLSMFSGAARPGWDRWGIQHRAVDQ